VKPPSGSEAWTKWPLHPGASVVLIEEQAWAMALWTAHTYAFESAEATPYIHVTSPEKRSGKTRLLETEEVLVNKPWLTGGLQPAVLARKIDAECHTLLLDEPMRIWWRQRSTPETLRRHSQHRTQAGWQVLGLLWSGG